MNTFQFWDAEEIFKTFETENYEFATLSPIISVTCHKAMLLIGGYDEKRRCKMD